MKIGIVGSGLVGATSAYAIVMRGIGREIVLVDRMRARADAEANDIQHAVPFAHPLRIRSGDYPDLAGCRVVIVAAGVGQRPGEARMQLLQRNAAVFREIVPRILEHATDTVLLIATNPVDVMTHVASWIAAEAGVDQRRILGSGTTLDTARFRALLGSYFDVDSHHVHAYVIGEHGDSEVLTWSLATIAGVPLQQFSRHRGVPLDESARQAIDQGVRRAAQRIIEAKGATYYGIGSAIARIVDAVLHDQRSIMTVCCRTEDVAGVRDVTLALPHVIGGIGVLDTIPLGLDTVEAEALRASACVIRDAIAELRS